MPRDSRPVQHPADERAGLRQEGKLAGRRFRHAEIGVDPECRHPDPQAVRADDTEASWPRRVEHRLAKLWPKPGGDDDRGTGALLAERRDQGGDGRRAAWR